MGQPAALNDGLMLAYWSVAFGREKGEVCNDAEGMDTVKNLARNMAWLMKKLETGF